MRYITLIINYVIYLIFKKFLRKNVFSCLFFSFKKKGEKKRKNLRNDRTLNFLIRIISYSAICHLVFLFSSFFLRSFEIES